MKMPKTIKMLTLAVLTSCSMAVFAADVAPTNPQVSVQLWSIKDEVSADFKGTLKRLADLGVQGVEFAGIFGPFAEDPKGLKKFLDETGLKASGAHVGFDQLSTENIDKTIAFYKAIDCNYLIIPMDRRAFTVEGAKQVAAELEAIQQKLNPHGMHTGYHNHLDEMVGEDGATPWDVIGKNTSSEVILQQDVGWTEAAGKNPVDFIKAYPGRTITTHYKAVAPYIESSEHPILGQDTTDWKALIEANRTYGGTLWLVVEQEVYPEGMTPMQSVEASIKGLQKVIADLDAKK
jgi:sugar phosphate isomerase/epimerase